MPNRIVLRAISPRKTCVTKEYGESFDGSGNGNVFMWHHYSATSQTVYKGLNGTRKYIERQHPGVEIVVEE